MNKFLSIVVILTVCQGVNARASEVPLRDTVPSGVPQLFGGAYYKFAKYVLADSMMMLAPGDTNAIPRYPALKFQGSDNRWFAHDRSRWQQLFYAADTSTLSDRIDLKLNISDTGSMLSNYIRDAGWGLIKSGQTLRADTGSTGLATQFDLSQLFNRNIYNTDSTLGANRTITQSGRYLRFFESARNYSQFNGGLQTVQPDSSTGSFYTRLILPMFSGTASEGALAWRESVSSNSQSPSRPNTPYMGGWNLGAGGQAFTTGLPAIGFSWEPHYRPSPGSTPWLMEKHIFYITPQNIQRRIESYTINTTTNHIDLYHTLNRWSLQDTNDVKFLNVETNGTDFSTSLELRSSNSTSRIQINPNGASNVTEINAPDSSTLNFRKWREYQFGSSSNGYDAVNNLWRIQNINQGFTIVRASQPFGLYLRNGAGGTVVTNLEVNANTGEIKHYGAAGNWFHTWYTSDTERMRLQFANRGGGLHINTTGGTAITDQRKLYVNGSVGINKDSVPLSSSISNLSLVVQDTTTNRLGRINPSLVAWSLTGNSGTTSADNFIGTTDNVGFNIRTNNSTRLGIAGNAAFHELRAGGIRIQDGGISLYSGEPSADEIRFGAFGTIRTTATTTSARDVITIIPGNVQHSSGTVNAIQVGGQILTQTGNGVTNWFNLGGGVNQGSGTGIIRGMYIAQGVVSATDYRALEVSNGKSVFNASVYIKSNGNSSTAGPRSLYVNGSIGANKDSIPLVTAFDNEHVLLLDTTTGMIKRVSPDSIGAGITNMTVASENGFMGNVNNPTTAPEIELSTTLSEHSIPHIDNNGGLIEHRSLKFRPSDSTLFAGGRMIINPTQEDYAEVSGIAETGPGFFLRRLIPDDEGTTNEHGFIDGTNFSRSTKAYNSYDAQPIMTGTANYDHYAGFQSRPIFNGNSGTVSNVYLFHTIPNISGTKTISNMYHFASIIDYTNNGTITNEYGLYVRALKGTTKYGVWIDQDQSYFGGNVGIGVANASTFYPLAVRKDGNTITGNWRNVANFANGAGTGGINLGYDNSTLDGIIGTQSANARSIQFWTHDGSSFSEKVRITAGGKLGVSTSSPITSLSVGQGTAALSSLVANTNCITVRLSNTGLALASEYTGNSSSTGGSGIGLFQNDSAALASGDRLGFINFGGSSSTSSLRATASIAAYATQNWSDGAAYGSMMAFETTLNGSTARSEKMRLTGGGSLLINTTGGASNIDQRKLYINGSIGINKDSVPTLTTTAPDYTLTIDTTNNKISRRVLPKQYIATLSQTGTDDPAATVLGDNTIGAIVWTRNSAGNYTGTLSSAFTASKTWLSASSSTDGKVSASLSRVDADTVTLIVYGEEAGAVAPEDEFASISIEIRVYP